MNRKNCVNAFSIVEAMIGMVVTAVILSITFFIFSIVTERMYDFKSQNQLVNDLNRLTYSVNKDIFENQNVVVKENQLIFNRYSGGAIDYQFDEKYILRYQNEFVDTFNIVLKNIQVDSIKSESNKKAFIKLKFDLSVNDREIDLSFYKPIYPNEFLQRIKQDEF